MITGDFRRLTERPVFRRLRTMLRWYFAKFLEICGMSLLGSALYFGVAQNDMGMEVKLLALGAIIFGAGYVFEPRGKE